MAITDEQRDAIVGPVRDGLKNLVTGEPGLFQDRPGFIAGGGPTDPFSNAVRGLSQLNCRIWAAANKDNYSTRVNQGNARLCEPYLNDIGELPPEGSAGPPFTGGQCSAAYRPTGTYRQSNPNAPGFGTTRAWRIGGNITGPIVGIVPAGTPTGTSWAFISASGGGLPFQNILDDETGVFVRGPNEALGPGILWSKSKPTIVAVNRVSGIDNCGNPGDEINPPGTSLPVTPPPPNITIDLPGIGPIDVDVSLDADGNPEFCIEQIDTCFSIDIGADDSGGADGPPAPGSAGSPADSGLGGVAEGEAEPGQELVGVLVTVLASPPLANRFNDVSATVFRGIGYVKMGYPGLLGVDVSGSTVESPQFFHAQQRGLTAWAVRARNGFNLRVTPYYREE